MKRLCLAFLFAALLAFPGAVAAEDEDFDLELGDFYEIISGKENVYEFPEIEPEIEVSGGYRYVHRDGAGKALEYEYLHSSLTLGTEFRIFKFPHRMHQDFEFNNLNDHYGDFRYAYKDTIIFRGVMRKLYHNFDNLNLDPTSSGSNVDIRDEGKTYGTSRIFNTFNLRLKTPHYPLHIYITGISIDKSGTKQQRSLLGSGTYSDIVRTSQERDIGYETEIHTIGSNGHFGPLEADYSHTEKTFDVTGDSVLYDVYENSLYRSDGTYPHNQISETEGSTDTLKLHTSYTGKLVASTSFKRREVENLDSEAKGEYLIGSGGLTWTPITRLSFVLRLSRKDYDVENPETSEITDSTDPSNTYTYDVDPSISSVTDKLALTGRYRPLNKLTLKAKYAYEQVERSDEETWNVEGLTRKHIASLSANADMVRDLYLSGYIAHKETEDPSYNTESDSSEEASASLTWTPLPTVSALLSYNVSEGDREDLEYTETESAEYRDTLIENVTGSFTVLLSERLAMTALYAYMRNWINQDIVYGDSGGVEVTVPDVETEDKAHVYSLDFSFTPSDKLNIIGTVSHTRSSGEFVPDNDDLDDIGYIANYKSTEMSYSASGEYEISRGLKCGIEYTYSHFKDELDNDYDDLEDGHAHIVMLTLNRKWD